MRMPSLRHVAVLVAVLAAAPWAPARAEEPAPLLWEIRGETPSWVLGTIHLPDPRLRELPPAVERAFAASDVYCGELEMDATTLLKASAASLLPEGRTLRGELPAGLAERVTDYVERRGRDMALFDRFTVWAFMMQLTLLDEMDRLLTDSPLDLALYQRAVAAGKETCGLETLDEQLAVFAALTPAESAELLAWSLDDLEAAEEAGTSLLDGMMDLYLAGDLAGLEEMSRDSVEPDTATGRKFERLLVEERNARMAERIADHLRERPGTRFLFAVGALHATGDGGVPARLRRAGLEVVRAGQAPEPQPGPAPAAVPAASPPAR